jgi:hypothetical protein
MIFKKLKFIAAGRMQYAEGFHAANTAEQRVEFEIYLEFGS